MYCPLRIFRARAAKVVSKKCDCCTAITICLKEKKKCSPCRARLALAAPTIYIPWTQMVLGLLSTPPMRFPSIPFFQKKINVRCFLFQASSVRFLIYVM